MGEGFEAESASRLVSHCQNVDQARYLIENAVVLGPIADVLADPQVNSLSDQQLMDRFKSATGRKMFLDDFRRHLDWFKDVGLWTG